MWTGFFTATHVAAGVRILLKLDVAHGTFYNTRISLLDFLCEARSLYKDCMLSAQELQVFAESVKGLKIRTKHRPGHIRVYRVNGIKASADQLTFETRDEGGTERRTTIADYFAERYAPLHFPKLPCLHVVPPTRNIYFPLDVCELQWPQKTSKKLTNRQAAAMIRASTGDASKCKTHCRTSVDTPAILYRKNNRCDPIILPRDGAWSMDNQELYLPAKCRSYSLIGMVIPCEQSLLQGFCQAFHQQATKMGLDFPSWPDLVM